MKRSEELDEAKVAALAKKFREAAGKNRAEAARDLEVSRPSVFYAEEAPERKLSLLRKRIIERYSDFTIDGPVYLLRKKQSSQG
jgi:DNA-binding XRE family transcriptional regulator